MKDSNLKKHNWIEDITRLFHESKLAWLRRRKKDQRGSTSKQQTKDSVDLSSEDSFPASDPPAWTGGVAGSGQHQKSAHNR